MLVIELGEHDIIGGFQYGNMRYGGPPIRFVHEANLIYQPTLYPDTRVNIIKNRWTRDMGLVDKSVFMNVIKHVEAPIEVMVCGETYLMEAGRAYTWYIENNPTILTRKADGKTFYYVNRHFYHSESDYVFHKAIQEHQ